MNKTYRYYTVQTNKVTRTGYKTSISQNERVDMFEESDVKKAVRLYKQRPAANDIIFNIVTHLDVMPYYEHTVVFGERKKIYDSTGRPYDVIEFKDKKHNVDFFIPLQKIDSSAVFLERAD